MWVVQLSYLGCTLSGGTAAGGGVDSVALRLDSRGRSRGLSRSLSRPDSLYLKHDPRCPRRHLGAHTRGLVVFEEL